MQNQTIEEIKSSLMIGEEELRKPSTRSSGGTVDTPDLGSGTERCEGSSPSWSNNYLVLRHSNEPQSTV